MPRPEAPIPANSLFLEFAEALRELRRRAGLSYRQLAAQTTYSPATLSIAANGRQLPSWGVVAAFAKACGADERDVAWLRSTWEAAALAGGDRPTSRQISFHVLGPVRITQDGSVVRSESLMVRTVL